jgi:magnesium transporter
MTVVDVTAGGGEMELCWITETGSEPVPPEAVHEFAARDGGVLWVHTEHTDEAGMMLLPNLFEVRSTDVHACHARSPVPGLHAYADHFFTAMNGLARGSDGRLHFVPVKIFSRPSVAFTVLGPRHAALASATATHDISLVRERLETSGPRPRTAYELAAAIRMQTLQSQEQLVAQSATRIAELELTVMQRDPVRAEATLGDLFEVRHDLQTIWTNAAQTHELYAYLIEQVAGGAGVPQFDPKVLHGLRQSYGHLKNTTDLEREYLQEVLNLFETRVSTELNRFVRKITAWGTIGIAWTVIAGIYGMNFTHMPELNWQYGYPGALTLMAVASIVLAVFFHRRGWL